MKGGLSGYPSQAESEHDVIENSHASTLLGWADGLAKANQVLERFDDVVAVITEVLQNVARDGITETECRIAKGSLRGGLVLGLEDSGSRMNRIGRSELNFGEHRTIEQTLAKIDAVTIDEVNAVARRLLARPYGAAVVGPQRSEESLPQALQAIAG